MTVVQIWPQRNPFTGIVDTFYTNEVHSSMLQFTRYELIGNEWCGGFVPFIGW